MLTLYEFLNHKRKYIAAIYNKETQDNLREWCTTNSFCLSKSYGDKDIDPYDFKFHTTIIYSESIHILDNGSIELETPFKVRPFAFELLGPDKDIPVMKVDGHALYKHREHYEDTYKMRDKWDTYLPHISLSYVRDPNYDFTSMKLPKFDLVVDRIDIEDIADD